MPVCLAGSPCNLYSNLITHTLPVSLNLHICPEQGEIWTNDIALEKESEDQWNALKQQVENASS